MATAAVLNGTITANGYGGSYRFEYATDANYLASGYDTNTAWVPYAGGASAATVSAQLTGLTRNTTYHYALVASNGVDTVTTGDQTFTTATTSLPPSISQTTGTNLADNTATLQASLDPSGQDTQYFFEFGTSTCAGGTVTPTVDGGAGSLNETVSANVTGLVANTTYMFCLVATNATNTTTSPPQTFTTLTPATVTTGAVSVKGVTTATLPGTVNPNGFDTQIFFQYGTTSQYGQSTAQTDVGSGTTTLPETADLANLVASTTYHYRLVATNGVDTIKGPDATFTTDAPPQPPAFTDPGPSGLDDQDATINASINANGQPTTWTVAYGLTSAYGSTVSGGSAGTASAPAPFSVPIGGLTPDTVYHYQILATNPTGTTTEADHTFKTFTPPTVSTGAASAAGSTSADLTGDGQSERLRHDVLVPVRHHRRLREHNGGRGARGRAARPSR